MRFLKKLKIKYLPVYAFIILIFFLLIIAVKPFAVSVYVTSGYMKNIREFDSLSAEEYFNDSLVSKEYLWDINSLIYKLLGKKQKKNYYMLVNGKLVYTIPDCRTSEFADKLISFNDELKKNNKSVEYIQIPFQINEFDKKLPKGIEDYSNENTNEFIEFVRAGGIDVFDLREELHKEKNDYYSFYLKTDHHWKPETGFWAFNKIQENLEKSDSSFSVDEKVKDTDCYNKAVYDNFLGSEGRAVGPYYCGFEKFAAISPKFETNLTVSDDNGDTVAQGSAEETILFPDKLKYDDYYYCDMYGYYMNKDEPYVRIHNTSSGGQNEVTVTDKKIMAFTDSYSRTVIPYMAYGYRDILLLDLRKYKGSVMEAVEDFNPDKILVMYNPGAFEESNSAMFDFQ